MVKRKREKTDSVVRKRPVAVAKSAPLLFVDETIGNREHEVDPNGPFLHHTNRSARVNRYTGAPRLAKVCVCVCVCVRARGFVVFVRRYRVHQPRVLVWGGSAYYVLL